ncbi:MAG TPA: OmpA family protein [Burkholderiaceae bacterium]|nr:OmpA family protein [Burkholderiaceae bacterium]HRP28377.1 OmpA family protein [Burkholderiaceae bacterium]
MTSRAVLALGFAALAALAACAPVTNVVLLPETGGRSSAVALTHGDKQVVLDQPYEAARDGATGITTYTTNEAEVKAGWGGALAAQPARAESFTLYFVEGKDVLTDESQKLVGKTLSEIAQRPVPDVLVVGHTDAVGSQAVNDALAQRRADFIRNELIRLGVPAANIQVIARGKRAPLVPTADGVAEPRNRRVEIVVR